MQIDDLRLLGIPRSRLIIAIIYPYHDARSKDCPGLSAKVKLVECISVARVRPRTSKGITDLLLPHLPASNRMHVPLRSQRSVKIHSPGYLAGRGLVR